MWITQHPLTEDEKKSLSIWMNNEPQWEDLSEARQIAINDLIKKYPGITETTYDDGRRSEISSSTSLDQRPTIPETQSEVSVRAMWNAYHQTRPLYEAENPQARMPQPYIHKSPTPSAAGYRPGIAKPLSLPQSPTGAGGYPPSISSPERAPQYMPSPIPRSTPAQPQVPKPPRQAPAPHHLYKQRDESLQQLRSLLHQAVDAEAEYLQYSSQIQDLERETTLVNQGQQEQSVSEDPPDAPSKSQKRRERRKKKEAE